jgi:hypothetical protein
MQERIYLGVRNHDTGEYFVAACTLPAQIGRQHDVNNQVLLDPKYRTISRIHGMIERTPRGFVYTDNSASGSRVGGLVVRDSRVALQPLFKIDIENYTIERVELSPFIILQTDQRLLEIGRGELVPGRGLAVVTEDGQTYLTDLNRWTEWDKPQICRFETLDQKPLLAVEAANVTIRRNKSPLTQRRTELVSLDVIEVGNFRFEVLHPHENRIVCGYDRCHLLNAPPIEANCRFCGRHLANAGGFSRVL